MAESDSFDGRKRSPASRIPPVMVDELLPTLGVTRMPPEVITFVPLSVTVVDAAALKRRLWVLELAEGELLDTTVVLVLPGQELVV